MLYKIKKLREAKGRRDFQNVKRPKEGGRGRGLVRFLWGPKHDF